MNEPRYPEDVFKTIWLWIGIAFIAMGLLNFIIVFMSAVESAGPEPDMAAKKQEQMTVTRASPLRRWPTQAFARAISFSEMPACSMMLPARMKKGMASRENLWVAA